MRKANIMVRLDEKDSAIFKRYCNKIGVNPSATARSLIIAFCDANQKAVYYDAEILGPQKLGRLAVVQIRVVNHLFGYLLFHTNLLYLIRPL